MLFIMSQSKSGGEWVVRDNSGVKEGCIKSSWVLNMYMDNGYSNELKKGIEIYLGGLRVEIAWSLACRWPCFMGQIGRRHKSNSEGGRKVAGAICSWLTLGVCSLSVLGSCMRHCLSTFLFMAVRQWYGRRKIGLGLRLYKWMTSEVCWAVCLGRRGT